MAPKGRLRDWRPIETQGATDLTGMILRGHLLVELELRDLVLERVVDREPLIDARLSFETWMRIAASLIGPSEVKPWTWTGIRQLNSLRNQVAHNLSRPELLERLKTLFELIDSHQRQIFHDRPWGAYVWQPESPDNACRAVIYTLLLQLAPLHPDADPSNAT